MTFEDDILARTAKARQLQRKQEESRQSQEQEQAAKAEQAERNKARMAQFGEQAAKMLMEANVPKVIFWDLVPFGPPKTRVNSAYPGGIEAYRLTSLEPIGEGWHILTLSTLPSYDSLGNHRYFSVSSDGDCGQFKERPLRAHFHYLSPRTGEKSAVDGLSIMEDAKTQEKMWSAILDEGEIIRNALAYKIATGHEFIHLAGSEHGL